MIRQTIYSHTENITKEEAPKTAPLLFIYKTYRLNLEN